jgi:hypothetical protein
VDEEEWKQGRGEEPEKGKGTMVGTEWCREGDGEHLTRGDGRVLVREVGRVRDLQLAGRTNGQLAWEREEGRWMMEGIILAMSLSFSTVVCWRSARRPRKCDGAEHV